MFEELQTLWCSGRMESSTDSKKNCGEAVLSYSWHSLAQIYGPLSPVVDASLSHHSALSSPHVLIISFLRFIQMQNASREVGNTDLWVLHQFSFKSTTGQLRCSNDIFFFHLIQQNNIEYNRVKCKWQSEYVWTKPIEWVSQGWDFLSSWAFSSSL